MEHLIITSHAGWVQVTLNRPDAKNALNTAMLADIAMALTQADADPHVRAAVIHGRSGNFAAGADIAEIETKTSAQAAADPRKGHWAAIRGFSKPLIAAVDGFALGGGLELALMADLLVVEADAKLGLPETNLGLIPGAGGGQRLLALVGRARATRMILTGEVINAETALSWGIAAYASDTPLVEAEALASRLAQRAPLALMAAKQALIASEASLALQAERAGFEALLDSQDKTEGIRAFQEKRKPEFTGK